MSEKLNFSGYTQILSIIVSFLSLVLSSVKLFYLQRLGIFLDVDPSLKMIIYAALPISIQLLFPLFSLILMASYFRELVIVCVAIIILTNIAVLKTKCLKKKLYCNIDNIYRYANMNTWQEESEEILHTALFTSWISPCTVWSNNFNSKSYFLIVNSLTTLIVHAFCLVSVFVLTYYKYLLEDLSQFDNPPITHCFKRNENYSLR